MSNTEYRAVIKFFTRKGLSTTNITKESADVYGDSVPSCLTVAKWMAEFKDSIRTLEAIRQSARPTTTLTDESIRAVEEVVMRDQQISVRRVADELNISITSLRNHE